MGNGSWISCGEKFETGGVEPDPTKSDRIKPNRHCAWPLGAVQSRPISDFRLQIADWWHREATEGAEGTEYQRLVIGMRCKEGILEHAVAEWVIKCLTVIHLICASIGGGYRNALFGIEILVAKC